MMVFVVAVTLFLILLNASVLVGFHLRWDAEDRRRAGESDQLAFVDETLRTTEAVPVSS
jgi:hypothetical protein